MWRNREYELPASTIYLVPSKNWAVLWKERQQRFPYFPPVEQAITELNNRSRQKDGGVPVTVHVNSRGNEELRLYGSDYYLGLYSSQYEDGYTLSHIEPIDPRAHDMLADGVLLLKRAYYQLCAQLPDIPDGSRNCKAQIWQEWQVLEQQKQQLRSDGQTREMVTLAQKNYLDTVSSLIDITYQLEQEKYKLSSTIPYVGFTATDQQRSGLHDIYEFRLQQPLQIWQERYLLRIIQVPDLCGRIGSSQYFRVALGQDGR